MKPTTSLTTPQNTRSHQTAAYNNSGAGVAATAAAAAPAAHFSQRVSVAHPFPRPPAARTVTRWQQCVLSMPFLPNTAAAVLASATPDEVQCPNRDDESDDDCPRANKNALLAGKVATKTCVLVSTAAEGCRCPINRTREQDTKQCSTDFRLPYSHVSKRPQKEHEKLHARSDGR